MSSKERAAFIIAGLTETLLFVASILGFVLALFLRVLSYEFYLCARYNSRFAGAIARKQLFVMIYAYFIYAHFLLNVGIAAYLLWMITHVASTDIVKGCEQGLKNMQSQDQCTGLLNIAKEVYFVVASLVLLIELCMSAFILDFSFNWTDRPWPLLDVWEQMVPSL